MKKERERKKGWLKQITKLAWNGEFLPHQIDQTKDTIRK